MDIRNELERLRDEKYREFSLSLLPNADKSKMIGVRLPQLRAVAARIKKESPKGVMPDLPQGDMFEEKLVRGFIIASADLPFEEHHCGEEERENTLETVFLHLMSPFLFAYARKMFKSLYNIAPQKSKNLCAFA